MQDVNLITYDDIPPTHPQQVEAAQLVEFDAKTRTLTVTIPLNLQNALVNCPNPVEIPWNVVS